MEDADIQTSVEGTHMQMFRVLPDLTFLYIVPFGILEALLEILSNLVKGSVSASFQLLFDVIKSYWSLDLFVIVGVLPLGG